MALIHPASGYAVYSAMLFMRIFMFSKPFWLRQNQPLDIEWSDVRSESSSLPSKRGTWIDRSKRSMDTFSFPPGAGLPVQAVGQRMASAALGCPARTEWSARPYGQKKTISHCFEEKSTKWIKKSHGSKIPKSSQELLPTGDALIFLRFLWIRRRFAFGKSHHSPQPGLWLFGAQFSLDAASESQKVVLFGGLYAQKPIKQHPFKTKGSRVTSLSITLRWVLQRCTNPFEIFLILCFGAAIHWNNFVSPIYPMTLLTPECTHQQTSNNRPPIKPSTTHPPQYITQHPPFSGCFFASISNPF